MSLCADSSLFATRDRRYAFDLRLKWSERNLDAYRVRGPRTPLSSGSACASNSSISTSSANAVERISMPSVAELTWAAGPLAAAALKMEEKMLVSCFRTCVRVLSDAGTDEVAAGSAAGFASLC